LRRELSFTTSCICEAGLLLLALIWAGVFQEPVFASLHWNLECALTGIAATLPPFFFFIWTLKSKLPVFLRHRDLLESVLRPMFGKWSIPQLLALSIIAGLSEEALFRGAIQGSLSARVGVVVAVVMASALFGAFHLLTYTYAIIAAFIGAYLGLLWIGTGNLLTPMVTHALYDFAALVYFLRVYRSR
jgi:membrane protease YdiL (CAAX protease family)